MKTIGRLALGLMLCTVRSALAESIPGEWILSLPNRASWSFNTPLRQQIETHFQWIRSFGPDNRFALVRRRPGSRPLRPQLKGIKLQPNYRYSSLGDPDLEKSWGLLNLGNNPGTEQKGIAGVDIGAAKAWAIQPETSKVLVAVLDSGVDLQHEDLKKNVLPGWNFADDTSNVQDDNRHGTFVASVIAADGDNGKGSRGIANGPLLVVKVLDQNGVSSTERCVRAIEFAIQKKAKILNLSWGGPVFDPALYETIERAGKEGILVVAAAGNRGDNNDLKESTVYPAAYRLPNVIAVAAYDNRDSRWPSSNFGKETVHLGAPGVSIFGATFGGYRFGEGTSFAAPFVTGVAALVLAKFPNLSVEEVRSRLLKTSVPIDYYEKEYLASGGRVNAHFALTGFEPPRPKPPTEWKSYPTSIETVHPYPANLFKRYEVSHPGAKYLRVHFARLTLEPKYDEIVLKDKEGRVVRRYSGDIGEVTSADAIGDFLAIEFQSDNTSQDWGFRIDRYDVAY